MTINNATASHTAPSTMPHENGDAPPRRVAIDPRSTVAFGVRKMGMYEVRGRFTGVEGYVEIDAHGMPLGGAAVVDAASVTTRMPPRDRHLRGRDFLDVSDHPAIEVTVTHVRGHEDGMLVFPAEITLHGVQRRVDLYGHLHPADGDDAPTLHLGGTIDRRDFGIRARPPFEWVVGRDVRLDAELVLTPARRPAGATGGPTT